MRQSPLEVYAWTRYRGAGCKLWRNRIQSYDSTFTLAKTDGIGDIHVDGVISPVPSLPAVSVFNDTKT